MSMDAAPDSACATRQCGAAAENHTFTSTLPTATDTTLEVWRVFKAHYAFFQRRGVDWNAALRTAVTTCCEPWYTERYSCDTPEVAAFRQLCELLAQTKDAHVMLTGCGRNFCAQLPLTAVQTRVGAGHGPSKGGKGGKGATHERMSALEWWEELDPACNVAKRRCVAVVEDYYLHAKTTALPNNVLRWGWLKQAPKASERVPLTMPPG